MKNSLFVLLSLLLLTSCSSRNYMPEAQKGELDLSTWSFEEQGSVDLNGKWLFYKDIISPDSLTSSIKESVHTLEVPGNWSQQVFPGPGGKPLHYGTYHLTVKLPEASLQLALNIKEVSTAYRLYVNGEYVGGTGTVGKHKDESRPSFISSLYMLDVKDTVIHITIQVSNFHYYEGGILNPIALGLHKTLIKKGRLTSTTGGFLKGLCFLNFIFFLFLFVYRRKPNYYLYCSLSSLFFLLLFLCINDRWLITFTDSWIILVKGTIFSLFLCFCFSLLFVFHFFEGLFPPFLFKFILSVFLLLVILGLLLPAPAFTYILGIAPYVGFIFFMILLYVFLRGLQQDRQGARALLFANFIMVSIFLSTVLMKNVHIAAIEPAHFGGMLLMITSTLVLGKDISNTFKREEKLSADLTTTNKLLEKQNINLESIVKERTARLMEAEKQAHQLQMEKKEQDLDTLSANNLMKMQYIENLIADLESLAVSGKDIKKGLYGIVFRLKGQFSMDEKQQVLHSAMDRVNTEFYERLKKRFPELTRTEHELCAYIKLNLSNQEIAELRNTTLNTINVMRSRIRKKLGLDRQDELETFIMNI